MKRSQAVKKIKAVLQTWENCKLDTKCASTVLAELEKMGLICPPETVVAKAKVPGKKGLVPVYGMAWEPERKQKIPIKHFQPLKK